MASENSSQRFLTVLDGSERPVYPMRTRVRVDPPAVGATTLNLPSGVQR